MPFANTRRVSNALRALALAALLLPFVARGQQAGSDRDLERVRADITRMKQRLETVRQQAKSTEAELEATDLELAIRTRELQLAVDAEMRLDAERKALETQIGSLEPQLARQRQFLARRLAALYRLGGLGYVRLFFSMDGEGDPLEAVSMMRYLVQRDARTLEEFRRAQSELGQRRAELSQRQARVAEARTVVEGRRREVAASRVAKEKLLATLRTSEEGSQKQLVVLEEKARRLERLVTLLSQQRQATAPILDIRSVQGALPWPVEGKVAEKFGKQRDPKFATVTNHNGLKITARPGTPVRTVFQGTVLFSQWFKGYGNLIIIDHGNHVFTLYGNLKSPAAGAGERIAAGQAIAAVGEGEDGGSGHLYFEVRQNNRPEDPQKWLR